MMKHKRHIFRDMRERSRGFGEDPEFDWHASLAAFAVLFALVLAANALIFYELGVKDREFSAESEAKAAISRSDITKAIKVVRQRDSDRSTVPETVLRDPSL